MNDLFNAGTNVRRDAVISECGQYRYWLSRHWDDTLRPACFVMLNPSTADARQDDPTIRRCVSFARSWGAGGVVVVNLFAFRSTDPSGLRLVTDPVGPENDTHLRRAVEQCHPVVAAWGAGGGLRNRAAGVQSLLLQVGLPVTCLGVTKDGHPRHPLYVKGSQELVRLC